MPSLLPASRAAWARLSLWASLSLAYVLPSLRHVRDDAWDYDEGPLLQAAALAREGARLYSEVSLNKPPVLIWILRAGFALGDTDVVSARLAVLSVTLAGFLALGALSDALFGAPSGLCTLALLLCAEELLPRACVVMPDLPAISLAALALLCAHRFARDGRSRWWALSALAYTAAVGTHPLIVGVALPITALVVSATGVSYAHKARVLGMYAALVLALAALLVLPYDRAGMLRWMVRYNLAIRRTGNGLTDPGVVLIGRYLRANWAFVLLAGASALWLARDARLRVAVLVAALWFGATVVTFSLWQPLWDNYYLWLLVALVMLSGGGLGRWVSRFVGVGGLTHSPSPQWGEGGRRWRAVGAGGAAVAVMVALAWRGISADRWRGRAAVMQAVEDDLRSVTRPGEYVASDDPFMVFQAGRREPPSLADTSHKSIVTGYLRSEDALDAVRRYRVRVVVMGTGRMERMEDFIRAVRGAAVDRRVIGEHERVVIDLARLR